MPTIVRRYTDRIRHARRAEERAAAASRLADRLMYQGALLGSHPLACAAALAIGASERQARAAAALRGDDDCPRGLAWLGCEVRP